jgi:hypothetical protein
VLQEVLDAVVRWTEYKDTERGGALLRLMGAVRLGLLSVETLAKRVAACAAVQRLVMFQPPTHTHTLSLPPPLLSLSLSLSLSPPPPPLMMMMITPLSSTTSTTSSDKKRCLM